MLCLLLSLVIGGFKFTSADLPTDLDEFQSKLFDTEECEDFISSGQFTAVGTTKCGSQTCDFPRQFCVRPAAKFQDKNAERCKTIPENCLTAANGGISLGPPSRQPNPFLLASSTHLPLIFPTSAPEPEKLFTGMPVEPRAICSMAAPSGRFCGFKLMYTYNKETFQCDQFFFPGCRTEDTNDNLFDDYQTCMKIADMCKPNPTPAPKPNRPKPKPQPQRPNRGWNRNHIERRRPRPARRRNRWDEEEEEEDYEEDYDEDLDEYEEIEPPRARARGRPQTIPRPTLPPSPPPQPSVTNSPLGSFAGMFGSGLPGLGSATGPVTYPGQSTGQTGDDEDLGLFGLIQKGLQSAQAIKQGGPKGKQAAAQTAGQLLQTFTGFNLDNVGGNFANLFNG